jgi:hypothetical protein
MSAINLDTMRLPKRGAVVRVRTAIGTYEGELVGIVPARSDAAKAKDRRPKLALRNSAMSVQLAERDIRERPTVVRRAPRGAA